VGKDAGLERAQSCILLPASCFLIPSYFDMSIAIDPVASERFLSNAPR
jgi:hypothetical protein